MSVDNFGRYQSAVKVQRETQRSLRESVPYRLSDDGNIDVENKIIRNLGKPSAAKDAVSLSYIEEHCLLVDRTSVDVKGRTLSNVANPVHVKDAVNKIHLDEKCLQYSSGNVINARNHTLISVGDPQQATDAANKAYVDKTTIRRKGSAWNADGFPLARVGEPAFTGDAVNVRYLHEHTVSFLTTSDDFTAAGKKITNVADGSDANDVVNMHQLDDHKRLTKRELYAINSVLRYHIDRLYKGMNKLRTSTPRVADDAEEPEWTLDPTTAAALIEQNEKSTKDWRSLYTE